MEKQFVITGDAPKVTIEAQGELVLKGWDEARVQVKNSSVEHITIEQDGNDVLVRCASNCTVRVPEQSDVHLRAAMGSATIKNIAGTLTVEQANGDLVMKSVGATQIGEVKGSLVAKNVFGDLQAHAVRGNATVRDIQGDCTLGRVYGNLQLDDVDGETSAEVNGNALLRFDPLSGNDYRFTAQGNLQLSLPKDASAQVKAACKGQLSVNLPGTHVDPSAPSPQTFTLGEGDADIELSAQGNLQIFSQAPDWGMGDFGADMAGMGENFARMGEDFGHMGEEIAQQVSQQIEAQMEMMAQQIESQMTGLTASLGTMGMSEEQRQRIEERARQASERAAARAQEKMRLAQERMERKMEALQRRAEQRVAAGQRRGAPRPPVPPMPPMPFRSKAFDEPVREDERMVVLRMLEQNKITLEQADQLLAALEGKA
ncbi:MAG: hypothetical protein ACOYYS_22365 [Chloroflexota bacterium]